MVFLVTSLGSSIFIFRERVKDPSQDCFDVLSLMIGYYQHAEFVTLTTANQHRYH